MANGFDNAAALLVGIRYSGNRQLPCAPEDAKRMRKLLSAIGFDEKKIELLTDPEATLSALERGLDRFCVRLTSRSGGGLGVIFFAGHGESDAGRHDVRLQLLPSEDRPDDATEKDLVELVQKVKDRTGGCRIVLFIDTCRSGNLGRLICSDLQYRCQAVVAACGPEEDAHEATSARVRNGLFTRRLAYALAGLGGKNDQGEVTIHHVLNYLHREVPLDSWRHQHPYYWSEGGESLVVGSDLSSKLVADLDSQLSAGLRRRVREAFRD